MKAGLQLPRLELSHVQRPVENGLLVPSLPRLSGKDAKGCLGAVARQCLKSPQTVTVPSGDLRQRLPMDGWGAKLSMTSPSPRGASVPLPTKPRPHSSAEVCSSPARGGAERPPRTIRTTLPPVSGAALVTEPHQGKETASRECPLR